MVWECLTHSPLFLDQTHVALEIDRSQVEQFYHPLAIALLDSSESLPRLLVAVAGPPGSGKTAFATILVAVLNAEAGNAVAVLVGLDGWHYPNTYLDSHCIERNGELVPLRRIKGAPETFDAAAAFDSLFRMRQGGQVSFPVYSRTLHEPIAAAGMVDSSHRIVVVEGNYLLLDEEPWRRLRELFDVRIFVSASPQILVHALRERHMRGGKTQAAARRHIRTVDLPNVRRIIPSAAHAHIFVYKANARYIEAMEYVVAPGCAPFHNQR